jgi:hypothetical protein
MKDRMKLSLLPKLVEQGAEIKTILLGVKTLALE